MEARHANVLNTCRKLPVVVTAAVAAMICSTMFGVVDAGAQTKTTATTSHKFDVASIRPSAGAATGEQRSWGDGTGRVTLRNVPMKYLLLQVYNLQSHQLSGPAWLDGEFFDILAVAPAGTPKEQLSLMFEALLAERFRMRFHRETHMTPVYALVVGEGGPKLRESAANPNIGVPDGKENVLKRSRGGETISGGGKGVFGEFKLTLANGILRSEFASMTTKALVRYLNQGQFDLPVVDMTDLTESYQIVLEKPTSDMPSSIASADQADASQSLGSAFDPPETSLRASLEKQGLKLVRKRAPIEKFVIDHIERTPTEN